MIWKPAPRFEGIYEVSDTGLVRRVGARLNGAAMPHPHVMRQKPDRYGYPTVTLTKDGRWRPWPVHRLVCEAFHGPAPSKAHQAAHRNGHRADNRQANLYWATPSENAADKQRHGTTARGERQSLSKLSAEKVREIRRRAESETARALAAEFGVTPANIGYIIARKTWAHVQ